MMKRKRFALLAVLALLLVPAPRARAFDPVTLAILAPMAVRMVDTAKPYLIRAGFNLCNGVYRIGKDAAQIVVYLPIGLGEMTFGAPFGHLRNGSVHALKGGVIAPGRLLLHTLLLPLYATGVKMNTGM